MSTPTKSVGPAQRAKKARPPMSFGGATPPTAAWHEGDEPAPNPAAPAAIEPAPTAAAAPVAPRPRRAPAVKKAPARRVPARIRADRVPAEAPPGYAKQTKPMQVHLDVAEHFKLKTYAQIRGRGISDVVTALVSLFTHDPDLVVALMDRAADEGMSLGEYVRAALVESFEQGPGEDAADDAGDDTQD